ncbi:MAG: sulfoxide reductase heme-binding subunit YedZ [Gammaproteobacteria bacterium]|nr:sulfoxide reductase heme-binding subunit YedZ [Gammaproteobacteria bacterium]
MLCLLPLLWLLADGLQHHLGANPVEKISHRTGDWTLRLVLLTLMITPLRRLTGWNVLIRLRRMLGLYSFFYACLHFLSWLVFDHFFDLHEIVKDIIKRPYITVGFAAFVLLIPLAVTSTNRWIKRLGSRWVQLHQLVYVIATGGVLHYLWLVKADVRRPVIYALLLAVLLAYRAWVRRRTNSTAVPRPMTQSKAA